MNSSDSSKDSRLTWVDNQEQLIGMIYRSAAEPEHWPELLEYLYTLLAHQAIDVSVPLPDSNDTNASTLPLTGMSSVNLERKQVLLKHFNQALSIAERIGYLEQKNHSLNSLLNHIPVGVILLNAESEILLTNELSEETLQLGQGLSQQGRTLVTEEEENTLLLQQYVRELSEPDIDARHSRGLAIPSAGKSEQQSMVILSPVNHLSNSDLEKSASVVLFISPSRPDVELDLTAFAEGYKLTPKEQRIVNYIAQGVAPPDIAGKLFVSYNTVRTQLKSVYKKTGVNSQSELASLVLTGPWGMLSQNGRRCAKAKAENSETYCFTLPDGRKLCYQEYGAANGSPVIYCHSILGCRLENFFDQVDIAKQQGLRLIIIDRPGFGGSDYAEGYSFVKWSEDLQALLDHLQLEQVEIVGYATGGVYAACAAATIPERISHLSMVSSGDTLRYDSDYQATAKLYRMHMKLARDYPKLHRLFAGILDKGLQKDPNKLFKVLARDLPPSDLKVLQDPCFRAKFSRYLKEAKIQGSNAFSNEVRQVMSPWQFEAEQISVPTTLYHGQQDRLIPVELAKRFASRVAQSQLHIYQDQGHYIIYRHWPEILQNIAKRQQ